MTIAFSSSVRRPSTNTPRKMTVPVVAGFGINGADAGESVGKDPKQSAIAEAGVRGCLDDAQKFLNFTFDKCRRFAFGPRKSLGLDFPGRIHGQHSFFGEPGKQHTDGCHVLFDCRRRGQALQGLDIRRDRDGLNVFKVLVTGTFTPRKKLFDRPVVGGSGVRVADRDREKFKEFFSG
jgi:hypothetical protein